VQPQIIIIIDAVKVSTCFYSGFFLVKYMMTKKDSNEALDVLRLDFCTKYLETLPKRTSFIQNLRAI
jgi:hypothetical protein